jgi:hypothetical protein
MEFMLVNVAAKPPAWRVCFAGLAALLCFTAVARAEECVNTTSTTAEPDFTPCDVAEPQIDLDAVLAAHAATASNAKSADGTPWIAEGSQGVPLTVNSSATGISMRTSLGTWRDYNVSDAARTIDTSKSVSPLPLTLPKAASPPKSPLDIWSSVDVEGYEGSGTESMRAGLGADLKLSHTTTVGVTAERGDAKVTTGVQPAQDEKMAAYVKLQAVPLLTLDARTEWQAGNAEFAATSGAAEKSTVILAPKINHSFALDGGQTIEPFVTYKREFDLSAAGREANETGSVATQSAGAGVTFTNPDAYSLSVTADVEGLGATTPESLSSKFKLSVPIR